MAKDFEPRKYSVVCILWAILMTQFMYFMIITGVDYFFGSRKHTRTTQLSLGRHAYAWWIAYDSLVKRIYMYIVHRVPVHASMVGFHEIRA